MKKILFLVIVTLFTVLFITSCVLFEKSTAEKGNVVSKEGASVDSNAKFNTINIIVDGELKYSGKYENNNRKFLQM